MKKAFYLIILLILIPLVYAGNYGSGSFGTGSFGEAILPSGGGSSSGGSSGGSVTKTLECSENSDCKTNEYCSENKCIVAECFEDSVCNLNEGETCFEYKCVKLFDMEILDFKSPVKVGEFFNFSYFVKAVAEINGDVEIDFWIENSNKEIITSGKDTIYLASYDEKTKTKNLFLPENISSGTYTFYIEIIYEDYTASAHRTIGIEVEGGIAKINLDNRFSNLEIYLISILIGLGAFIVCLIFYLEKRKIKKELTKEKRWIQKHKISILAFILLIIFGILIYYLRWTDLIVNWIKEIIFWVKNRFT